MKKSPESVAAPKPESVAAPKPESVHIVKTPVQKWVKYTWTPEIPCLTFDAGLVDHI